MLSASERAFCANASVPPAAYVAAKRLLAAELLQRGPLTEEQALRAIRPQVDGWRAARTWRFLSADAKLFPTARPMEAMRVDEPVPVLPDAGKAAE